MFNKNSGDRTTFYHPQSLLLLLFTLQITFTQICLQYSGPNCTQCTSGYQLVSGGCVSITANNYTSNPILIFQDIPGVQKILYNVNPVIVTITSNVQFNQTITPQNIVNEFQVKKVQSENTGNYYEVRTNTTSVKDYNELLTNSSILKEISQKQNKSSKGSTEAITSISTSLASVKQVNETQNLTLTNDSAQNRQYTNLTAIKQVSQSPQSAEYDFTLINRANSSSQEPANFTLIKQTTAADANLTAIKQTNSEKTIDLILTPIKQSTSINLTQVNQLKSASEISLKLTQVNSSAQQSNQSSQTNITTSNSNNTDFLFQLQQINQRLTQVGQADNPASFTQAKMNQPSIVTPVTLTQVNPSKQPTQAGGAVTIQLTQVGQQLTQISQQLTQAKLLPGQTNQTATDNFTQAQVPTTTVAVQTINHPKLIYNSSKFQLPSTPQDQPKQNIEQNLTAAKQLIDINWIKATRYELYNLTFVSQAFTQAKFKQSNSSVGTVYTFKCTTNLILFVPLTTASQPGRLETQYSKYINATSLSILKQLSSFTQADKSTLCLDPPFQKSIQYLQKRHTSALDNLPIFSVYYQYCGFAKTFRIFFIDDSQLPRISIYEGQVVVDLFRMVPVEVFFSNYNSTTLQS